MAKRGIRVMLWVVIVVSAAITAYFFWVDELAIRRDLTAVRAFHDSANAATRAVLDLRAAQQAYVATGQGSDFWGEKSGSSLSAARQALGAMRTPRSEPAQRAVVNASSTLEDFEQMDRRAREYVAGGQLLMASDVIFSGGLELTESALNDVAQARTAEQQASDLAVRALRQRQWLALASGAAAVALVSLLLVPVPRTTSEVPVDRSVAAPAPRPSADDRDLRPALNGARRPPRAQARSATVKATQAPPATRPPADVDFPAVATLCADLARVTETHSLPPILERASTLLDAAGVVLWIADPDGRELAPIVTHGYPPQLVTRLGTIGRDAENVTAAAFRTGLLQTVKADVVSNGAIAAPLVTPAGCVGVMAAEVRNGGEQKDERLAAATIVAAQLATLVGPPVARKAEAAGG